MTNELTLLILCAALFASLAAVLMLIIRKPARRWLGAGLSYQAWLIVPLVTLAAVLPSRSTQLFQAAPGLPSVRALVTAQSAPIVSNGGDLLIFSWLCGALALSAWFIVAHHAFLRKAGSLSRSGGVYMSSADVGPASVGLFRPKIIVPFDFRERYSPIEQELVIAHERTHIRRGDAIVNLIAAIFQCVFWFNPLIHIVVRCFRQDQEIACDALVVQRHPHQRRAYAEALLKFHADLFIAHTGINCHWQHHHPTKERLMSLQLSPSGTVRSIVGRCLVTLLAAASVAGTLNARAEQAASAPSYAVNMTLDAGGEQSAPRILAKAGEKFAVKSGEWRFEMTVRQADTASDVWLAGKVFRGADLISAPTLRARLNEKATIKVGDADKPFALSMVVSPQP